MKRLLILCVGEQQQERNVKRLQIQWNKHAFVAVKSAGCQAHGLPEMDDGFLNTAHISQCCPLQEEGLHTVAVQLDGLRSQVQGSGVTLAVKAVAADQQKYENIKATEKKKEIP